MAMRILASAASAAVLALALPNDFAPYGIPLLGFVCLLPYFAALGTSRSYAEAALLGAVFGCLSHLLSSYWLSNFQDYAVWTIGATTAAYGLLHAIAAIFLRRFSLPETGLGAQSRGWGSAMRPFAVAAIWAVWEWRKSVGFLGYPWGLVAYSVNGVGPLIQIADLCGVYGLSFLLALSSASLVELGASIAAGLDGLRRLLKGGDGLPGKELRPVLVCLALVAATLCYGAFHLAAPTPAVDQVALVLVQHNADTWVPGGEGPSMKTCQRLSREGIADVEAGRIVDARTDRSRPLPDQTALVAWSETVLHRPFLDYRPYFRKQPAGDPFLPFLESLGVPLLTGAPVMLDWKTYDATNSALLLTPSGEVAFSYAKMHLVPFAESIPFWDKAWMRALMKKLADLEGQWTPGKEAVIMKVPTASGRDLRFGAPICFEDAFADVCALFYNSGADILVNLTNDSWSRTVSAETQHLAVSRFRAVENRRALVRSTNAGVTAVIDAEGRVAASLPLFEEAVLPVAVSVQRSERPTLYAVLGDWFPLAFALLLFLPLALEPYRSRTRKRILETEMAAADTRRLSTE